MSQRGAAETSRVVMKYVGVTMKVYPPSTSLCGSSKARQLKPYTETHQPAR